jgi:hypothetical protein
MRKVVANLDNDWVLSAADIDRAIAEIEAPDRSSRDDPQSRS